MADAELILRVNVDNLDEVKMLIASLREESAAFRAVLETEAETLESEARMFEQRGNCDAADVLKSAAARLREALK